MTLRDHLGPRTPENAALHDELDRLEAAPAAVLMEAAADQAAKAAELYRRASLNDCIDTNGILQAAEKREQVSVEIRALATTDSTAALKRVIGKALEMAGKAKPLEWKKSLGVDGGPLWMADYYLIYILRDHYKLGGFDEKFPNLKAAKAAAQADYQQRSDAMRQSITADDVLRALGERG